MMKYGLRIEKPDMDSLCRFYEMIDASSLLLTVVVILHDLHGLRNYLLPRFQPAPIAHHNGFAFMESGDHFGIGGSLQAKMNRSIFELIIRIDYENCCFVAFVIDGLERNCRDVFFVLQRQICIGIQPRNQNVVSILNVDFGVHSPRIFAHIHRKSGNLSREVSV